MNRARTSQQIGKNSPNHENGHKVGMQGTRSSNSGKATTSGRQTTREKKLALLHDVDSLKKKLQDEENIHKALQRAFNRPLGALPRLPSYLPPNTQELLAEIAVLEEEVIWLEEQVVTYRQNLYQEAVYICSKRKLENPVDYYEQILSRVSKEEKSDREKSPLSVARSASTSSGVVSDRSSLSVGGTTSASSDLVSVDTMKKKRPVDVSTSTLDSGENGKVIGNQMSSSSNQTSDTVSHLTEASSSGLINGKETMDEVKSTADSWENRKGRDSQTCSSSNQNLDIVSHPMEGHSSGLINAKPASEDLSSFIESYKNGKGEHDNPQSISPRNIQLSERKLSRINTARKASFKRPPSQKSVNSPIKQPENKSLGGETDPNKVSEDILQCLCSIFIRMSTIDKKTRIDMLPYSLSLVSSQFEKETKIQDPYGTGVELKERDIGVYKDLCVVDAKTVDLQRRKNALFLLHKLKLLLGKLARVQLDGLTHHHKLAFWINTYNSCLMNGFLEHGIPDSPEKVVLLMREATIAVAGQTLNAITIEHFILRLPFYLKHGGKKAARGEELKASEMFGLKCAEPLITFALSCGSWSSPAVRIYTGSQVESELEVAKRDYLQAAVRVSNSNKLIIPKLLELHQLAKDLESLVDWVCLHLPDEFRKEALICLQRKGRQPLSGLVEMVPYDFTFRYLLFP